MSDEDPASEPVDDPLRDTRWTNTPWAARVVYSPRAGGYARRPGHLLCLNRKAYRRAHSIVHSDDVLPDDEILDQQGIGCKGNTGKERNVVYSLTFQEGAGTSVEDLVDVLAEEHLPAEPNYVMFANPMFANPMFANPMFANPMFANPMFANPVYANPVYASPVYANPVFANPMYANAYICDGVRPSTARPAAAPTRPWKDYVKPQEPERSVVILDTGIAARRFTEPDTGKEVDVCPKMLMALSDEYPNQWEIPDNDEKTKPGEGFVDPVSGHGTFIAGIVQTLAADTEILPRNIVTSYGDVDVLTVMKQVVQLCDDNKLGSHTIVNMSFGGYADEKMSTLQRAIRCIRDTKAVVVASAGNDATDRPAFPACLPQVVGVGALDSYGPAPYSNSGSWVNACAPGTDLVSAFYRNFNGKTELPELPGSSDPDKYESWVRWTGTSFAAPVVTAALLREMRLTTCDANTAVERIIDAPGLFRIAGLGTVVNLDLGDPTCLMPSGHS